MNPVRVRSTGNLLATTHFTSGNIQQFPSIDIVQGFNSHQSLFLNKLTVTEMDRVQFYNEGCQGVHNPDGKLKCSELLMMCASLMLP